jgi:transcriptional regulator with XRE-family HTH domain
MLVYSSHLLRYEELRVGERIRDARQDRRMTLKQLADRMGTSSARLSQIENDHIGLDIQELLAFADALELPLDRFVPADVRLPYQITRDSELRQRAPRPAILATPDGDGVASPHSYWPLAGLFVGQHLEPILARITTATAPRSIAASRRSCDCCARCTAGRRSASRARPASANVRCCGSSAAIGPFRSKS